MFENDLQPRRERHPVVSLIIILLMTGLSFVILGPAIGFFIALPFYPGSAMDFVNSLQSPAAYPELKMPLYIMQGFATFFGLILAPLWYLRQERKSFADLNRNRTVEWIPVIITVFVVIVFMAVNSIFVEWNANFKFPEFAREFEQWARDREDAATEITEFLTQMDSTFQLLVSLFVIAVLPAIGEELVFRGLIQHELVRATKNVHVAIWIAAVMFSAIHIQFFGFVPRMLLGALFGYLYLWSGNIWIAILAHFVNNATSVISLYLYQQGVFQYDMETTESAPLNIVVFGALVTAGLLYYFYKYFENKNSSLTRP